MSEIKKSKEKIYRDMVYNTKLGILCSAAESVKIDKYIVKKSNLPFKEREYVNIKLGEILDLTPIQLMVFRNQLVGKTLAFTEKELVKYLCK